MYETEVNNAIESIETVPLEIRKRFAEFRDGVAARTILPWGEHCTECVWPTCYTTCDLYVPRQDGACRQFVDGMVRIDHKEGLSPYLLKIRFKQWAKLWTVGNLHLEPLSQAETHERWNMAAGAIGRNLPAPASIKPRLLTKISYLRRQWAEDAAQSKEPPDFFLLECYNPNANKITLTITIRHRIQNGSHPFQKMIELAPGYTRAKVAFSEISKALDMSQAFEVELLPNGSDDTVLYFGLMDFVKARVQAQTPKREGEANSAKLKCLVWDLDNTLWDGILIEDGPEKIRIRQGVVDVIKQLDERGILHSIASKNNHDDAMKVLRRYGIEHYFLYPQIRWEPKSQSIAQIARSLNIGVDSIAFVDDQVFERSEVTAVLPQVLTIDAVAYEGIPGLPGCQVPITAESANRRLMYREQEERSTALESHQGDYFGFLRECQMEARITPLDETNLKRVYELAQRTNQLNFSGNRYQEARLAEIINTPYLETYVIECSDRFGNYGIVGFGMVDTRIPVLLDLMFSCRVQGKRVEHAILGFLLKRFVADQKKDFHAHYRKTPKNAPGGKVFEEVGFEQVAAEDGLSSLVFRRGHKINEDQIVDVKVIGLPTCAMSAR